MFFSRWHPEVAIRYLPIVREIKKLSQPTILEVGSGGLGIAPYLGRPVTGLDKSFAPPFHPLLKRRVGSGTKLPFPDKSFDVVIAVDTLEHVKPANRPKVIAEMRRVAKKEIIVAVPTGGEAAEQDRKLNRAYKKIYKKTFPFLDEQQDFGLPTKEEIGRAMGDNVRVENNEPLALRNFLMRGWMQPDFLSKLFYWKVLLFFIPLFNFFDHPPYYRTIFYKYESWH